MQHLVDNELLDKYQSAYRKGRGVETAVLSVFQGLLTNMDERLISLMAFLDLSAAFDTLDHSILLKRLEITFGINDTVLKCFLSYVTNRTQSVIVDNSMSRPKPLSFGVPQGSVLGPILFTLYVKPLSAVIERHACQYHKYADDTKLSKSTLPVNFPIVKTDVETCITKCDDLDE